MITSFRSVTSQINQRTFSYAVTEMRKVAIVGGGVSGLQTLDRLKGANIDVTLFESQPDIGGYWRTADSGKQSPRELFEFPGYPC